MVLHAADMRREYSLAGLDESDLDPDPFRQFGQWFVEAQAAEVPEPNAMVLATASADGAPAARIVLLKGFDERGFLFYSNYESPKGRDLAQNPRAALTFYWAQLERQVRISGLAERISRDESRVYFDSRPVGSRIAASLSRQSEVISGREQLAAEFRRLAAQFERRCDPATRVLGRLPGSPGMDRVLAGTAEPAPRPASLSPRGRRLGHRAPVTLTRSRPAVIGCAVQRAPPAEAGT